MLYYRKDCAMSGLHRFMVREATSVLDAKGTKYKLAQPGEDVPDIMAEDFDVEIETGLKKDIKTFARRLSGKAKTTYVIVPNKAEKVRYESFVSAPNVAIMTLGEALKSDILLPP